MSTPGMSVSHRRAHGTTSACAASVSMFILPTVFGKNKNNNVLQIPHHYPCIISDESIFQNVWQLSSATFGKPRALTARLWLAPRAGSRRGARPRRGRARRPRARSPPLGASAAARRSTRSAQLVRGLPEFRPSPEIQVKIVLGYLIIAPLLERRTAEDD